MSDSLSPNKIDFPKSIFNEKDAFSIISGLGFLHEYSEESGP